jgi:hypothetical protein
MNSYQVVAADTTRELESKVSEMILNGWVPTGGPIIIGEKFHQRILQAVYLPLEK